MPLTPEHHAFMQAVMARGAVPETEARQLYKELTRQADGAWLAAQRARERGATL
jgi:hypothetical protein